MRLNHTAAAVLCSAVTVLAGEAMVVERDNVLLRQGAGAFHPVVAEVVRGATVEVLQEHDGWFAVQVGGLRGYISRKALAKKPGRADGFARMAADRAPVTPSPHGISAGVKGFAERFTRVLGADPGTTAAILGLRLDPAAYARFREATYDGFDLPRARRAVSLPDRAEAVSFSFDEEGMGLAIAARIAGPGLRQDPRLLAYLNCVGQLVVESTDAYDVPFRFQVLEDESLNAFACPGGPIFVTTGLLRVLQSEAELACVLAHEIAHVSRYHGMQEMEARRVQILADGALAELDRSIDAPGSPDGLAEELEEVALVTYERIVSGRLQDYEREADRVGLRYAARSGYDPRALLDLLARRAGSPTAGTESPYAAVTSRERVEGVRAELAKLDLKGARLRNAERFVLETGSIR